MRVSVWFPWEGAGEAEQAGLGLSTLDNFPRRCGGGAVPRGLGQRNSGPEHESQQRWWFRVQALNGLVCLQECAHR